MHRAWHVAANECAKKLMKGSRTADVQYRRIMDKVGPTQRPSSYLSITTLYCAFPAHWPAFQIYSSVANLAYVACCKHDTDSLSERCAFAMRQAGVNRTYDIAKLDSNLQKNRYSDVPHPRA